MIKLFNDYVKGKAEAALSAEQAYPLTDAQIANEKATFLDNVPASYKTIAQNCISSGSKATGAKNFSDLKTGSEGGVYFCGKGSVGKGTKIELDGSKGPYIIIVKTSLTFGPEDAYIKVTNNETSDDSKWLRIILLDGAKIDLGEGGSGSNAGIMTASEVTVDKAKYQKANAYIYGGNDTHVYFTGDHKSLEAYVGLYGPKSSITVDGKQGSIVGRWECSNITTTKANGTQLPWSPMPTDGKSSDTWKAKETNYEIVRFRYFY